MPRSPVLVCFVLLFFVSWPLLYSTADFGLHALTRRTLFDQRVSEWVRGLICFIF